MALSGVITNNFRTGYQLRIEWTATQNVAANTSTITAKMYLKSLGSGYNIVSSTGKTATIILDGTTYTDTVTIGLSGNEDKLLFTTSKTVSHSSAGEKTFSLGGSLYMGISFSSGYTGTVTLTTTNFALNTIPRTSIITSFPNFTIGSGITVSAARNSTTFTNEYQIYIGGTVIHNTGKLSADSYAFSAAQLDAIYAHVPNGTSISVTAYVNTFSGTTLIGQSSATAVAYVGSDIIPTLSSVTAAETASAITALAMGTNQFAQSLSRIRFTINGASGTKSSTIASYNINFNSVNYGQNGVTSAVNRIGAVVATATVTDSRGRVSTARTVSVTFHAYTSPSATFTAVRNATTQTTINTTGSSSISSLDGKNQLTYSVHSKLKTSSTWTPRTGPTALAVGTITFNPVFTYLSNLTTSSYDYKLTISDKVGGSIEVVSSVGTEAVPMSWSKTGIAAGKIWERGALDVGGDAYVDGKLTMFGGKDIELQAVPGSDDPGDLVFRDGSGVEIGRVWKEPFSGELLYRESASVSGKEFAFLVDYGSNANGWYVRYSDGTQLCWGYEAKTVAIASTWGSLFISGQYALTFPIAFTYPPSFIALFDNGGDSNWMMTDFMYSTSARYRFVRGATLASTLGTVRWSATGRWKA